MMFSVRFEHGKYDFQNDTSATVSVLSKTFTFSETSMCSQQCCSEQSCIKHHRGNRKITDPTRSYRRVVQEIVFAVLKTHWKHHKRKDQNILHRSYTQKEFSTPKKIFFDRPEKIFFWKMTILKIWIFKFLGEIFFVKFFDWFWWIFGGEFFWVDKFSENENPKNVFSECGKKFVFRSWEKNWV